MYRCFACGTTITYGTNCPVCLEQLYLNPQPIPNGTMSVKEFVDSGLLQEINRRILHPIGIALCCMEHDDGTVRFHSIWDGREDPDGIIFESIDVDKIKNVDTMLEKKRASRTLKFGWHVQEP